MSLKFLNIILVWAQTLTPAASAQGEASGLLVQLLAQVGDRQIWTLSLTDACEVRIAGSGWTGTKRKHILAKQECDELKALLPQARQDLARHKTERPAFVTDEPMYQLKIGQSGAQVSFKAPEACEILDDGDLRCEKLKRTSAERLVFGLRNIALRMNGQVGQ